MPGMLTAWPNTPPYVQLEKERRLRRGADNVDDERGPLQFVQHRVENGAGLFINLRGRVGRVFFYTCGTEIKEAIGADANQHRYTDRNAA